MIKKVAHPIPVSPITMSINSSVHHVLVLCTTTAHGYLYQIQHFMTRNYRKYICSYCTITQDYLKTIFSDDRRSTLINDNDALDHLDNGKITKLQKELDKKKGGDLANLNGQMGLVRSHENNNITLIHEREKTIDEMQEKISEIEHLDGMEKMFHQLESKLGNLIERKLDEKMVTINKVKESIVQEVKSNNDCFEQKLDNVIQNNKSFAHASASSGSPLVPDQELNEENDKKRHAHQTSLSMDYLNL